MEVSADATRLENQKGSHQGLPILEGADRGPAGRGGLAASDWIIDQVNYNDLNQRPIIDDG